MIFSLFILFLSLLSAAAPRALSVSQSSHFLVHDSNPDPFILHRIVIALPLESTETDKLPDLVHSVSHPLSPNYGRFYSRERLKGIFPTTFRTDEENSLSLKQKFLTPEAALKDYFSRECSKFEFLHPQWNSPGFCDFLPSGSGDFLIGFLPLKMINRIFQTKMIIYRHSYSNRVMIRSSTKTIEIPSEISPAIEFLIGMVDFFDSPKELRGLKRKAQAESIVRNQQEAVRRNPAQGIPSAASSAGDPPIDVSCGANSPESSTPYLSESIITPTFTINCQNGSSTNNPNIPCLDFPPALQTLTVSIISYLNSYQNFTTRIEFPVSQLLCSVNSPSIGYPVTGVSCQTPPLVIPPYSYVLMQSFSTYVDGTRSNMGVHPIFLAPSPYCTPSMIYATYSLPANSMGSHPGNSQAVIEFDQSYEWTSDLMQYFQALHLPPQLPVIIGDNNASSPLAPGSEPSLDLQLLMSTAPNITTIFWTFASGEYILDWAIGVHQMENPPLVTSISFGDDEFAFYDKFGNSWDYVKRMEIELGKMALRGLSVLVASGDAGVSNAGAGPNDLHGMDLTCTPFQPSYPTTSRYVTGISASFLTPFSSPICSNRPSTANTSIALGFSTLIGGTAPFECSATGKGVHEVGVSYAFGNQWTTGGGFSSLPFNPTPDFQASFVSAYLNRSNFYGFTPPSHLFAAGNRAYPDATALGHNTMCVVDGQFTDCSGTSASTPIFSGLISLLNDALLQANYPPLGFLNPLLYYSAGIAPSTWNRIRLGSNNDGQWNPRCSNISSTCPYGFHVLDSPWNPVTGLGSLNYKAMESFIFGLHTYSKWNQWENQLFDEKEERNSIISPDHHIGLWILYTLLVVNIQGFLMAMIYFIYDYMKSPGKGELSALIPTSPLEEEKEIPQQQKKMRKKKLLKDSNTGLLGDSMDEEEEKRGIANYQSI